MRLLLINPVNPLVSMRARHWSPWNRYHVWKPLGLLVVAALTPEDWEIEVVDEHLGVPDYRVLRRPDLVGITAFTSQAPRAYALAAWFRELQVPVVLGGIHASLCVEEAMERADAVVVGEAESVWSRVVEDVRCAGLQRVYRGGWRDLAESPAPRHDLLPDVYHFGSLQTSRGCPLRCHFCSVTAFNGGRYRCRPIEFVLAELAAMREPRFLFVDDNLVGTRREHADRLRELFRAMIDRRLARPWIGQVTLNFAEDPALVELAARSGCIGLLIGFESADPEGLRELGKRFNARSLQVLRRGVQCLQRQGILVAGSFMLGLDRHHPGVGRATARLAAELGLDVLDVTFLTALPGTDLWQRLQREDRLALTRFPEDWSYYTLALPVTRHPRLSGEKLADELQDCYASFYGWRSMAGRFVRNLAGHRQPWTTLAVNLSCRQGALGFDRRAYRGLRERCGGSLPGPVRSGVTAGHGAAAPGG